MQRRSVSRRRALLCTPGGRFSCARLWAGSGQSAGGGVVACPCNMNAAPRSLCAKGLHPRYVGSSPQLFTASSRQDIAAPVFANVDKQCKPLPCPKKKPRTGGGAGEIEDTVSVRGLAHAWRSSGQPGQLLRAVTTHMACMKKAGTRSRFLLAALDAVDGVG